MCTLCGHFTVSRIGVHIIPAVIFQLEQIIFSVSHWQRDSVLLQQLILSFEILAEMLEVTFGVFVYVIALQINILSQRVKRVRFVDFEGIHESEVNGVLRAEIGATHTDIAFAVHLYLAFLINIAGPVRAVVDAG